MSMDAYNPIPRMHIIQFLFSPIFVPLDTYIHRKESLFYSKIFIFEEENKYEYDNIPTFALYLRHSSINSLFKTI